MREWINAMKTVGDLLYREASDTGCLAVVLYFLILGLIFYLA
jgi:hypothetical protein